MNRCKVPKVGRQRTKNKHLPKYMTLYHGSYFYRGPGTDWKRVNLGRDYADALGRYGDFFRETGLQLFSDVCDRYQQLVVPRKAPRTQIDDLAHLDPIRKVFGKMRPRSIRPVHIYRFRDKCADKHGIVQANLILALLKHIFTKAIEWEAVEINPAKEVRKIPRADRDRYVEGWEFELVYNLAPDCLQIAMDIALLTGMDRGDIIGLERDQCKEDGIHYTRSKTLHKRPKKIVIEWSEELRAVVARAKKLPPQFRRHIVATRSGKPFSASGFSTMWQRTMIKAAQNGLDERFHFHDLRALNATEEKDLVTASERLGHSSTEITKRVYRRKPVRVKPLR